MKKKEEEIMSMKPSEAFLAFAQEAPEVHAAWMETVERLGQASALDQKTKALAYLAVLAAARLESGLPFHVRMAKASGATRDEVVSSILVGLPAVGHAVIGALPIALEAYDREE
jgi:alkylhydroperoxidase/carboxymuconolactone decarboxylase family protein YurZ